MGTGRPAIVSLNSKVTLVIPPCSTVTLWVAVPYSSCQASRT